MNAKLTPSDIDWDNLDFSYRNLPYRIHIDFQNGEWQKPKVVEEETFLIHESAVVLHYSQTLFEGLKAYRTKDGSINLFRPYENAKRLNRSAEQLLVPQIDEQLLVDNIKELVRLNQDFVPPYGKGQTLYIRPVLFGSSPQIGVSPATEYKLIIFGTPVGLYYKKGLTPSNYLVASRDRAAGFGMGTVKTGGNYAASLKVSYDAKHNGFSDTIFLDPIEHKYIDETSGANFFGITYDDQFQTPKSDSILPSITKKSILQIAQDFGLNPIETKIPITSVDSFKEAGAMGTAAIISPIGSIQYENTKYIIGSETEPGTWTQKLYDELTGIQFGEIEDKYGWIEKV